MKQQTRPYNALIWGITAIAIGLILILWPQNVIIWAIYLIATISLIGAVTQFSAFLVSTRGVEGRWRQMPITSVIAFIWGVLLLINPALWTGMFMVVFGLLIIFLSINQIMTLIKIKRSGVEVRWGYYVFPSLFLLSGFTVFTKPLYSAEWIMIFIGAWIMAYGITEMFGHFSLKKRIDEN